MVGAIASRVVLIVFALQLLALPLLKILGALMLLWIGLRLLQPEDDSAHDQIESSTNLLGAIKTIVGALFVIVLGTWYARRQESECVLVEEAVQCSEIAYGSAHCSRPASRAT